MSSKDTFYEICTVTKQTSFTLIRTKLSQYRAQRLINLEIPVLVRSLNSSNVELDYYLDGSLTVQVLPECCC